MVYPLMQCKWINSFEKFLAHLFTTAPDSVGIFLHRDGPSARWGQPAFYRIDSGDSGPSPTALLRPPLVIFSPCRREASTSPGPTWHSCIVFASCGPVAHGSAALCSSHGKPKFPFPHEMTFNFELAQWRSSSWIKNETWALLCTQKTDVSILEHTKNNCEFSQHRLA